MSGNSISRIEFTDRLRALWPNLIELVLSQPSKKQLPSDQSDVHPELEKPLRSGKDSTVVAIPKSAPTKVTARRVTLKAGPQFQFTSQVGTQQTHRNLPIEDALDYCLKLFPGELEHLHLFTQQADVTARMQRDGTVFVRSSRPTKSSTTTAVTPAHNRSKQYLIPENVPCQFLFEIGVMNRDGKVHAAKQHKFRQINRFLELVVDVLPELPSDREIQIVDFGSGKSYLTFAIHHLLTVIQGRAARIHGVDLKANVMQNCSRIASDLGCEGLSFHHGDIARFSESGQVDMMVSLHACDTATDAALAQAVKWKTPVVLAVPCCQHEVAAHLRPQSSLTSLLQHGILKERFSAMATDALRANLLELCGYQAQVIEFIDPDQTPKNLLIRAVRRNSELPPDQYRDACQRYAQFKSLLGIPPPYLERALIEFQGAEFLQADLTQEQI